MIPELIFGWAEKTPDKTALIYNQRPLSYRAFAEQIGIARGYFLKRGYAGPGYAVIAFEHLLDFWILSLALRSLGLTTLTVGNTATLSEIELANIRCVVTRPGESWPDLASLCTARDWPLISVSLANEPSPNVPLSDTRYESGGHILFTSGTTGRYKLVLHTSTIDTVIIKQKADVANINQDSVFCVFAFGSWTGPGYKWAAAPWMAGGTTVIDQGRATYHGLLNRGLTHAYCIPAVLDLILAAPENAFPRHEAMRLVVAGGALTQRQIRQARARITPRICTMISSTEVGTFGFTPLEEEEDRRWHRLVPHRGVEIVSESGDPVPVGEIGRLRISTTGGPTGYLGDEAASNVYFKDGYFYPGDLAVAHADGRIALQGRFTDVINVRGQKIFPGPVEDRLCDLLGVKGVCLFSKQNEGDYEDLYVAIETSATIDKERIRAALDGALNEFPAVHVRFVPSLPRNSMGKVARQVVRAQITGERQPT